MKVLQTLQSRCSRLLTNNFNQEVCSLDILSTLGILNISQRLNYLQGLLMYKCLHEKAPNYLSDTFTLMSCIHSHYTRHELLQLPKSHSSHNKRSFAYSGASLWNSLPADIKGASSFWCYKQLLYKYFMSYTRI